MSEEEKPIILKLNLKDSELFYNIWKKRVKSVKEIKMADEILEQIQEWG